MFKNEELMVWLNKNNVLSFHNLEYNLLTELNDEETNEFFKTLEKLYEEYKTKKSFNILLEKIKQIDWDGYNYILENINTLKGLDLTATSLKEAFYWDETEQGVSYWNLIDKLIERNE